MRERNRRSRSCRLALRRFRLGRCARGRACRRPPVERRTIRQRRGATFARLRLHGSLGSTGLRPMPPHCYRDPAHGPGVGSGLLPRLPPPTCSSPVSGVGLGPCCYAASLLQSPAPRPPSVFRSAICDCLSLNVSILPTSRQMLGTSRRHSRISARSSFSLHSCRTSTGSCSRPHTSDLRTQR